jgi:EAL domain-containing protein (putative c-di-GMP-specific phosphodiesterase class I)
VETAAQADALVRLGVDRAQGHHFGRPGPAADFGTAAVPGG